MKANVIWSPQPKQALMMSRPEYEALYGGAAGGGKTDYMVIEALRQVHIPYYKGVIFRRTYKELEEIIDKTANYYPKCFPKAKYNQSNHQWKFPSGASIKFRAMEHIKDRLKYQGHAYDFIGFDELTHFDREQYEYLKSRNRPNGAGTKAYIRATANPGGVGHGWVKEYFMNGINPGERKTEVLRIDTPEGRIYKALSRIYIPSSVFDNKKLIENDPNYIARLASLPDADRKALLYGDWDSFSGQTFTEWRDNPEGYLTRKWTHVIKPFEIPEWWTIYRGYDFGYAKPYAVGWYAMSPDNVLYRIAELYGFTGTPNEGTKENPYEQARNILEMEREHELLKGRKIHGIADPAIFNASMGESVASIMEKAGIYFDKGDHERIAGKMQCHYRLAFDENGYPKFQTFQTCKQFIRTIPSLVYSEKSVEDINTEGEDHIYDEWRYICMSKPVTAPLKLKPEIPTMAEDPLNLYHDEFGNVKRFSF